MILYIAEKPSLGRAIADALPTPHKKGDGCIYVGKGDVVSWCIGHLLEQAQPESYDPVFKKWSIQHLPIVPDQWKLEVKPKTKKQFNILKKLIRQADVLVNVGDPDREGQILVDEVISFSGVSASKRSAAKRCLISDLNINAVKKSLNNLRDNNDFIPLATSALARARADWLYGINMTRLCTLQGQKSGFNGVLSIGRVQTPLLGLVVHRDHEIEGFVSKPFYEVFITLKTGAGECYQAKWKPSEACESFMDEDGRVLSRKLADNVVARVVDQNGLVKKVQQSKKKQPAPLPYNLSALQIDAAKRYGLSAKQVLDLCQQLYEKHKLITYPRSDCRYLPMEHYSGAQQVTAAIAKTCHKLSDAVAKADLRLKSKAWNDSKISAHHAIIPTAKSVDSSRLSSGEANLYELIARQYLIQFYPPFEYMDKQIDTEVSGGLFVAKQKDVLAEGWKTLFPQSKPSGNRGKTSDSSQGEAAEEAFSSVRLPDVQQGDAVLCTEAHVDEKQTSPPKHFTDATLLAAMTGIARFVNDPVIKKVLRDTDGLGTEATRAGIIELLFTRQFLTRSGKEIRATDVGRQLITSLPENMTHPDMTAHWESQLEAISQRELKYNHFMQPMALSLRELIAEVGTVRFDGLQGKGKAMVRPRRKKPAASKRASVKNDSVKSTAAKASSVKRPGVRKGS